MNKNAKAERLDSIARFNRIIEQQTGKAVRPFREDGYVNLISRYGTKQDVNEHYQYVAEPEYPDELIESYYESNGLFSKIIDAPAEEAVKHGFTLAGIKDTDILDFCDEALDELDWEEVCMDGIKWARLFGGAIAVMLINDGRGLEEPLDWRNIKSIDDIRVFDRSVISPDYPTWYVYDAQDPFRTRGSRLGTPETYYVTSRSGSFRVHESRCLVFQNGKLPELARNSNYQLWGVPEFVRIRRALRDTEIAHGSAPKLLERSVQAIYKMKDLAMELATPEGEEVLLKRLNAIDLARGMMNSIAIDSEGEDYDFKTFSFGGVNDVISASCNMLSAVSNIPQAILFGQPISGMSSTDDTAMENYYNYIERIQRRMVKTNLRYLLAVIFQAGVKTGEIDEVPKIKVEFNPLWSMTEQERVDIEQRKASIQQTKASTVKLYVDMQVIDPSEVRAKLADSDEFDIDTMLDETNDEDLLENIPNALKYLSPEDQKKALELYGHLAEEGQEAPPGGVELSGSEQNTDPGTEGSASTAAPAATKLPQDMSEEELLKVKSAGEKKESNTDGDETPEEAKASSVGVICLRDGMILAAQRKEGDSVGKICGPGGHIESGETPVGAAARETREEFGIVPQELKLIGFGAEEGNSGLTPAIFLCTEWEGEPHPVDGEMGDPMWLTMEAAEAIKPALFEPFAYSLEMLKRSPEIPEEDNVKIVPSEPEGSEDAEDRGTNDALDFTSIRDKLSLQNFILGLGKEREDGAPYGNKNAVGPHKKKHANSTQAEQYKKAVIGVKTRKGIVIKSVHPHAFDKAVERNIFPRNVRLTLEKGKASNGNKPGRTVYKYNGTEVVVSDNNGMVLTVIYTGKDGRNGK